MISFPPIIAELARDRQLVSRDIQVWLVIVPRLEFVDFREVELSVIAAEFAVRPVSIPSVSRCIKRLIDRGFLERSEKRGRDRVWGYRIPLRRVYPRRVGD